MNEARLRGAASDRGALQHADQVARIVGVGEHVDRLKEVAAFDLGMNITQRRKILDRETDAVEQGDLARIIAPVGVAAQHLPEFRDGIVRTHLLRSEDRLGGKQCDSTDQSWGYAVHLKKKKLLYTK